MRTAAHVACHSYSPDTICKREPDVKLSNLALALLAMLTLVGCQPTVYLMPTPEALRSGEHDPFAANPEAQQKNQVTVAYATNRLPVGLRHQRGYVTLYDDNIRLGAAQVRIGTEQLSAEELYAQSTTAAREFPIPLTLEQAVELGQLDAEDEIAAPPAQLQAFFDTLNNALERSVDKDLVVYVHGANNNFYRSMAQGAQYHHFTGRNSVILVYSWPSAESFLRYAVDVNNARASAPVFARLLDLLARHTQARHIDVLAYSAGAQIVSPALAQLRQSYADEDVASLQKRLRLGEVYFAAPDVDFVPFLDDLYTYIGMPKHVTLATNPGDFVLALAAGEHGVSRAGAPDTDELTEEERQALIAATREMPFDVIWVEPDLIPGLGRRSHSFWYDHPWISTDVLLQFLYHARPAQRGLVAWENETQARVWYFPPDYPQRVDAAINQLKAAGR